jgi:hypothetical protein
VACGALGAMASSVAWGASAAQAAGKGPGCGLVPASVVDRAYGAHVTGPTAQTKGPVTVCSYFSSAPVVSVLVRFEVNETVAMFKAGRKSFTAHKEPTVTVPDLAAAALGRSRSVLDIGTGGGDQLASLSSTSLRPSSPSAGLRRLRCKRLGVGAVRQALDMRQVGNLAYSGAPEEGPADADQVGDCGTVLREHAP